MCTCPWCGSPVEHEYLKVQDYFLSQESFTVMSCDHCHLLFTVPRPDPSRLGSYYKSEKYFSHQENTQGFIPRVYESVKKVNLRNKIRMASEGLPVGSVLDIGCGVGDFLRGMQQAGWKVTGIEPDCDAQQIALKRLNTLPIPPDQSGTLANASFDLITMWHVLEHVEDLHHQIDELYRLLKPGGRLLIAVPNYKSYDAQVYREFWAAWDVPRHLNHFSSDTLRSIIKSKSFQDIDIQKLKWDSYYISYLSETYMKHSIPLLRGFLSGLCSNLHAYHSGQFSSLVYRFQKL